MPEKAYRYPLPTKYYTENKVRKYGAHGTSHQFVAGEAAKLLGRPLEDLKLITCHIGNGASITAVKGGQSVDTSMGFTPLGGVMMGTRTGDIDPAIIPYLMQYTEDFNTPEDISHVLNRESGLMGVSGKSSDMRDVITAMEEGGTTMPLWLMKCMLTVSKTYRSIPCSPKWSRCYYLYCRYR